MTQPQLIVDPDRLASASSAFTAAAGEIPVLPPALSVPGGDPLSQAIAEGTAEIESPMLALPRIKGDAMETATIVSTAGQMYADTDSELAAKAARHAFASATSPGPGGSSPTSASSGGGINSIPGAAPATAGSAAGVVGAVASGAGRPGGGQPGGLSQMMGTPMQMAQQAGQIPAQLAQAAGSAPQGLMQGGQSAVQQVTQLAGQFAKSSGEDDPAKGALTDSEPDPARERDPQGPRPDDPPAGTEF